MAIQILIVDDHQIVREGVRSLLTALRPAWAVSEAGDGMRAIELIRNHNPDLVVMDITMPDSSGLEVVARLRKLGFDRPILMFTMHKSERLGSEARQAGAQGYVLKSQAVDDLIRAIDILFAGGTFFGVPPEPEATRDKPSPGLVFFSGVTSAFA